MTLTSDVVSRLSEVEFVGCSGQAENLRSRVALVEDLFGLAGRRVEGCKVLDCGCGRGTTCAVVAAMGATEVHGVDQDEGCLASFGEYIARVPEELRNRMVPRCGDASQLSYPSDQFDAVLMVEVISHIIHLDNAFREALRVLTPGGALLITDGNNGLNPLIRRRNIRRWDEKEELSPPVSFQSYRKQRAEGLKQRHPEAADDLVDAIATGTFGKLHDEVEAAYQAYLETGQLPTELYVSGEPAINPDGWYDDRHFNPFELDRALRGIGFRDVRVKPYWGRSTKLRRMIDDLLRLAPARLIMPLARGFRVIAIK